MITDCLDYNEEYAHQLALSKKDNPIFAELDSVTPTQKSFFQDFWKLESLVMPISTCERC